MPEASDNRTRDAHAVHSNNSSVLDTRRADLALVGSARRTSANQYVQLKQLIQQHRLLDQQPAYYTYKTLFTLSLLIISIAFLFISDNFWLQLLNAIYLGFVSMQFGLLGHDIGHRQIFRTGKKSRMAGFLVGNLLVGWSWSWWIDKHNAHLWALHWFFALAAESLASFCICYRSSRVFWVVPRFDRCSQP